MAGPNVLYNGDNLDVLRRHVRDGVKAGHLVPNYVRDLWGVIEREAAEIGVLISFEEPTAAMRAEAAEAGFHESPWERHPRIQLITVGQLLDGRQIDYPHVAGANVTHRRATRAGPTAEQTALFEPPEPSEPGG